MSSCYPYMTVNRNFVRLILQRNTIRKGLLHKKLTRAVKLVKKSQYIWRSCVQFTHTEMNFCFLLIETESGRVPNQSENCKHNHYLLICFNQQETEVLFGVRTIDVSINCCKTCTHREIFSNRNQIVFTIFQLI